ncbi:hypothetical protein [Acidisoma sp.]|uniref:hypothetical protein n=1 Tax=Acidisoma sp. TaxID=1872115 RepID=UPI003AFF8273
MAKSPGPSKGKAAAPAQFDMNSRERKGGKGRPGGPGGGGGRGRDEKRPPARIVTLPPAVVDRGDGWIIEKVGRVDQASHAPMGAEYRLVFNGHDPLVFDYLGAARERAKEPPPEKAAAEDVAAAVVPEAPEDEAPSREAGVDGEGV